jgi:hypothetical protein
VKLLLDENLSRRIVPALQVQFPGSSQVAIKAALADPATGIVVLR